MPGQGDAEATVKEIPLPEARSGAAAVAVSDGIVVAGGLGPNGQPTATVWKATVDAKTGVLGEFKDQPPLLQPVTDASIALEGTFLWVYGGTDANGPTATVQRADYGTASTATGSAAPGQPRRPRALAPQHRARRRAAPSGRRALGNARRRGQPARPAHRRGRLRRERRALPRRRLRRDRRAAPSCTGPSRTPTGNLPGGGATSTPTDLPEGRDRCRADRLRLDRLPARRRRSAARHRRHPSARASPRRSRSSGSASPGSTVPALQIGGEIGQQLGYLAAAGVGTGNFVILVVDRLGVQQPRRAQRLDGAPEGRPRGEGARSDLALPLDRDRRIDRRLDLARCKPALDRRDELRGVQPELRPR